MPTVHLAFQLPTVTKELGRTGTLCATQPTIEYCLCNVETRVLPLTEVRVRVVLKQLGFRS